MKKMILAILCAGLFILNAHAADIQVTAPGAGASWKIGTTQTVQWTFSGIAASNEVHIALLQNGTNLGKIAENVDIGADGHGSFSWVVGSVIGNPAATAGSGYTIKVRRTNDASVFGMSAAFNLTSGSSGPVMQLPDASQLGSNYALGQASKPPMPGQSDVQLKMIQVSEPKAGDVLAPYGGYAVRWKFVNIPAAGVSITLVGENQPDVVLAANVSDPGEFSWNVQAAPPAPGDYRITVETLDNQHRGRSGKFTVDENGTVKILAPQSGASIVNGSDVEIKWQLAGNIQKLDIDLVRVADGYSITLASQVDAKLGKKTVVLSAAEPGIHRISIKNSRTASGLAKSGNFIITGE